MSLRRLGIVVVLLSSAATAHAQAFGAYKKDPQVESHVPANGAKDVPRDAPIAIVLKTGIHPNVLENDLAVVSVMQVAGGIPEDEVDGSVHYDAEKKTLSFRPDALLPKETEFLVHAFVAIDLLAGKQLQQMWRFRTGSKSGSAAGPTASGPSESGDSVGDREPDVPAPTAPRLRPPTDPNLKRTWSAAMNHVRREEYLLAAPFFEQVAHAGSGNADAHFLRAECMLRALGAPGHSPPTDVNRVQQEFQLVFALIAGHALDASRFTTVFGVASAGYEIRAFAPWMERLARHSGDAVWLGAANDLIRDEPYPRPIDRDAFADALLHARAALVGDARSQVDHADFLFVHGRPNSRAYEEARGRPGATPQLQAHCWCREGAIGLKEYLEHRPGPIPEDMAGTLQRPFREALRADSGHIDALVSLGAVLRLAGRPDRARRPLERAAQLEPKNVAVQLQLHLTYELLEDREAAAAAWRRAVAASAHPADAWEAAAVLFDRAGRQDRALEAVLRAAQERGDDADAWWHCTTYCYERERYDQALTAARKAIECGRRDATTWTVCGELEARALSMPKALACFTEAARIERESSRPWRSIRLAAQVWGPGHRSHAEVVALIDRVRKEVGDSAAAYAEIGFLWGLERKFDASADAYVKSFDFVGHERLGRQSLWELIKILGPQEFKPLGEAIEDRDFGRTEVADVQGWMEHRRAEAFLSYIRSFSSGPRRGGGVGGGYSVRSHGVNHVALDVADAMRDWQSGVAGQFGSIGLQFTR